MYMYFSLDISHLPRFTILVILINNHNSFHFLYSVLKNDLKLLGNTLPKKILLQNNQNLAKQGSVGRWEWLAVNPANFRFVGLQEISRNSQARAGVTSQPEAGHTPPTLSSPTSASQCALSGVFMEGQITWELAQHMRKSWV